MHHQFRTGLVATAISAGLLAGSIAQATTRAPETQVTGQRPTPAQQARLGALALPFIRNTGQVNKQVAFYAPTFAGTAFVTHTGALVLSLPGKPLDRRPNPPARVHPLSRRGRGWVLTETPVSAAKLTPRGDGASPTRVSVFQGNEAKTWRTDLKTFRAVRLGQPWPGIRYQIKAHGNTIERIFTVEPGARAEAIRMRVQGAERLSLRDGRLVAETGNGPVTLSRPVAYQRIAGQTKPVPVAYVLNGNRYGFQLGAHDPRHPVIIDPLLQATYLGGSGGDVAYTLAVGSGGQVYVAGETESTDFPQTTKGVQPACGANGCKNGDAFVAELNAGLTALTQATYLGGSGDDVALALAVGSGGQVYVAGATDSTDFPKTTGGAQAKNGGGTADVFVAELNAGLTTLTQATYLGGSGGDIAYTLAVGSGGQIYVAGKTGSFNFPKTTGGAQSVCNDSSGTCDLGDAFVAELNAGLTTLTQATYLGGAGVDKAYTLAVGSGGQIYVAGETDSTGFPQTMGGAQATNGGGHADVFVAELNAGLTALTQATYLGGSGDDVALALAVGSKGQIYVAGRTDSTDFPQTTGGAQAKNGGGTADAFVAELNAGLTTLTQATYLGGSGRDVAYTLAVGSGGQVYVAGETESTDFPQTTKGVQPACGANGCKNGDAFVAELNAGLTTLTQSTYLGGSGGDIAYTLAVGSKGQVYVVGGTQSTDFPQTTGGAQAKNGGGTADAFAARYDCLTSAACPTPTPTPTPPAPGGSGGGALGPWALLLLGGFGAAALRRRRTQG